jgi:putative ABC transport system permease protein
MILVILFVVYGLVFTGIIIQNSVKSSKEYVRKELGAIVEMKTDFVKVINDQLSSEDYAKLDLSVALANEIAKDPLVEKLYISNMIDAESDKLKSAMNMDSGEGLGMAVTAGSPEGTFFLNGSNADIPLEFSDGTYDVIQGRLRNAEDNGKDTLLITEEFAGTNNLFVGDFVNLTSTVDEQTYEFEIIGILKGGNSFMANQMYTSWDSVNKLAGTTKEEAVKATSILFQLKDPMDVDSFIEKHTSQMPNEYIVLYANDSEYKALTRPLNLISTIISILLVVVFIAGTIIMLAIITIFVRDRKFEIGLLLSSGEGRFKILSQFVLEILLVSVLAFTIAAVASKFSSDYAASWIVKNQLVEEETSNGLSGGAVISIGSPGGTNHKEVKISDVAREFNISVDQDVISNLLLLSLGLVILSAGAPMLIILGYKPRESLQD